MGASSDREDNKYTGHPSIGESTLEKLYNSICKIEKKNIMELDFL